MLTPYFWLRLRFLFLCLDLSVITKQIIHMVNLRLFIINMSCDFLQAIFLGIMVYKCEFVERLNFRFLYLIAC
jgi:hypothetical protein